MTRRCGNASRSFEGKDRSEMYASPTCLFCLCGANLAARFFLWRLYMEYNIARMLEMVQPPTDQFEYIEREMHSCFGGQTFQWNHFSGLADRRDNRKLLMPVPETAYVEVNGRWVENRLAHFMDYKGMVYDYLEELDAAVLADYTKAYAQDGQPLKFSRRAAQKVTTLPLEDALAWLSAG